MPGPARLIKRDSELIKNPLNLVVRDNSDAVRPFARELSHSRSARAGPRVEPSAVPADIEDVFGPPPRLRAVGCGDD